MSDRSLADLFEQPMGDWRGKRGARVGTVPAAVRERDYDEGDFAFFKFDPDQPRDRKGRWTDGPLGGVGVLDASTGGGLSSWDSLDDDASGVANADLFRIGAEVGKIMQRDGTSITEPLALARAAEEALAADDSGINVRQYIRAMDRDYGTLLFDGVSSALRDAGAAPAVPAAPEPEAPRGRTVDFDAPFDERASALQASMDSGITDLDELSGGAVADTRLATWKDGSQAVLKTATGAVGSWSPQFQTDAEELSARVAAALDVRAPATVRADPTTLYLEYMEGRPANKAFGYGDPPERILESDQGVRMGLLDHLINNNDRHAGNWIVDDEGNIAAIDHGLSFGFDLGSGSSPFARRHFRSGRNPLTQEDVATLRARLQELRPEFVKLGKGAWFDYGVMARFQDIADSASGTRSIYA